MRISLFKILLAVVALALLAADASACGRGAQRRANRHAPLGGCGTPAAAAYQSSCGAAPAAHFSQVGAVPTVAPYILPTAASNCPGGACPAPGRGFRR